MPTSWFSSERAVKAGPGRPKRDRRKQSANRRRARAARR